MSTKKLEYKIQVRFKKRFEGRWVSAVFANGSSPNIYYDSKEDAKRGIAKLIAHWAEEGPKYNHEAPVEYRLIHRQVSEWIVSET